MYNALKSTTFSLFPSAQFFHFLHEYKQNNQILSNLNNQQRIGQNFKRSFKLNRNRWGSIDQITSCINFFIPKVLLTHEYESIRRVLSLSVLFVRSATLFYCGVPTKVWCLSMPSLLQKLLNFKLPNSTYFQFRSYKVPWTNFGGNFVWTPQVRMYII